MKKCYICLEQGTHRNYLFRKAKLFKTNCCKVFVHYHCQVAWGNECIICNKQIKVVSTEKFNYIPDYPELTEQEIEENRRAQEEIDRRRNLYTPLLEAVRRRLPDYMTYNSDSE